MRSKRSAKITLTILGALLMSIRANADILFIDLNNSPKEIEAAQRAAERRGERLVVVPAVAPDLVQESKRAGNLAEKARQTYNLCKRAGGGCASENEAYRQAQVTYQNVAKNINKLGPNGLKAQLAKLDRSGVDISSVVVSGHDGNGHFGGIFGGLTDDDLKEAFDEFPNLRDGVRSMLLWGCYTTTLGSLEFDWKGVFPHANMIAGFDDLGPSGERPANWAYLEDILVREQELTATRDTAEALELFKKIPYANEMHAAVCLNGDTVVTTEGTRSIKEEIEKCEALDEGEGEKTFQCYWRAKEGCEDVPADTHKSPLRDFYKHLQDTKHCDEILANAGHQRINPDQVVRLIFDRNVRGNFEVLHRKEMAELNASLERLGLPESLRFNRIEDMNRREWLDKIEALKKAYREKYNELADDDGIVADADVLSLAGYIGVLNAISKPQCIPFTWVEPNDTTESPCRFHSVIQEFQGKAQTMAYLNGLERKVNVLRMQVDGGAKRAELARRYRELNAVKSSKGFEQMTEDQKKSVEDEMKALARKFDPIARKVDGAIASQALQLYKSELARLKKKNAPKEQIEGVQKAMAEFAGE